MVEQQWILLMLKEEEEEEKRKTMHEKYTKTMLQILQKKYKQKIFYSIFIFCYFEFGGSNFEPQSSLQTKITE